MNFTDFEIFELRKLMYKEIEKLNCIIGPERSDFDKIKPKIVPLIAYKIWEKLAKPKNKDVDIWLEAEHIWDFIRFGW
jgi:hypothetical protein